MNKIVKSAMMIAPVGAIVGSVGVYFALSSSKRAKESYEEPSVKTNDIPERTVNGQNTLGIQVFPKIYQATYYKYLRVVDGEPQITDEMIAHVVNDVLTKMQYTDGIVSWSYNIIDKTKQNDVYITFRLNPSGTGILKQPIEKTYHLLASKP